MAAHKVTAAEVRAWGQSNGFPSEDGTRGRLSNSLVTAFNKGRKGANRYVPGAAVPTRTITVKPAKGRSVKRTYNPSEVRAALVAAGKITAGKGRMPEALVREHLLNV